MEYTEGFGCRVQSIQKRFGCIGAWQLHFTLSTASKCSCPLRLAVVVDQDFCDTKIIQFEFRCSIVKVEFGLDR